MRRINDSGTETGLSGHRIGTGKNNKEHHEHR